MLLATISEMLGQGTIILIIMIAVATKAAKKNPEAAKSAAVGAFSLFKRFIK